MWTERQLKLLEAGGNSKLYEYCEIYNLNNVEIKFKYQTKALHYYRKRNEAIALGKEFNDAELSVEDGRKLLDGTQLNDEGKITVQES